MKKSQKHNQSGQSTVEFLLTVSFILGIFFIIISIGFNYAIGYVTHYATFMASRTYLVNDNGSNNTNSSYTYAESEARKAFNRYNLSTFGIGEQSLQINDPTNTTRKGYVGVYTYYQRKFSMYFGGEEENNTNFLSESFLGKEPVRIDCLNQTCQAMGIDACGPGYDVTLFDNGC